MLKNIILLFLISSILISCQQKNNSNISELNNSEDTSINAISAQIRQNPRNAELFIKRSDLYLQNKDIANAINDAEIALKLDSLNQTYYTKLAELYIYNAESEKAKNILELCIARSPKNIQARIQLAELYLYLQLYKEAMTEIIDIEYNNLQNTNSYLTKALIFNETEAYSDAIQALQKAIEHDNTNWQAYNLIGTIYSRLNDKLAVEYFNTAINLFPDNLEIKFNAARIFQQFKINDKAIQNYLIVIEKDSSSCKAYYNLGELYFNEYKDYSSALKYFSLAIDCDTNSYKSYYNRGLTYERKGNFKLAETDYRKALSIKPNYELAIAGLNEVIDKQNR